MDNYTIVNRTTYSDNNSSRVSYNSTHLSRESIDGWFAFSILCSLFGSILFLLLLVISFHRKRLHTGSNVLVIHLMLLELLICGVIMPLAIIPTYLNLVGYKIRMDCHTFMFINVTFAMTDYWASFILAVNRFVAIALPHHYARLTSKLGLIIMIVAPWVIGLGCNLPVYFGIAALVVVLEPILSSVIVGPHRGVNRRKMAVRLSTINAQSAMNPTEWIRPKHFRLHLISHGRIHRLISRLISSIARNGGRFFLRTIPFEACSAMGNAHPYGAAWGALGTYLPTALMGVIYITLGGRWLIGRYFFGGQISAGFRRGVAAVGEPSVSVKARRVVLAKVLFVTYVLHCVCYLPAPIVQISVPWLFAKHVVFTQLWLLKAAVYFGYAVSPVVFLALSSDHQNGLQSLLIYRSRSIHNRQRPSGLVTHNNHTNNNKTH